MYVLMYIIHVLFERNAIIRVRYDHRCVCVCVYAIRRGRRKKLQLE